ncbi:PepSY-associated TM helix domain-containing protein [Paraglaciecola mesophila]|nr:PepSY-associated TM helix domain-containing protein [Paraglaciecola mesophila]
MNRATWFSVHSWLGVKLAIMLCFIVLTGTLAVISNELDWLANPAKRVTPSSVEGMNWQAVYATAQQEVPINTLRSIQAPLHPWYSAEVIYLDGDEQRHRLFFHPTTGGYLGDGRWQNWQRFFRMLHRHLMLPLTLGITVVSLFAVVMLAMLVSSLCIYKSWWSHFFRKPRWQHRKTRWVDLHRLVGVWSLWFLLIISVTGCWYLAERWGATATSPERLTANSEKALTQSIMPDSELLALILAQAHEKFPALSITRVNFPQKSGDVVEIQGQADAILVRQRANFATFDPATGQPIQHQDGRDLSVHNRISEAADPLHFGQWGGMLSKVLYFVFGLFLTGLTVTGTYMYGMRVARISRHETKPRRRIWRRALAHMKALGWVSAIGVCASIFYGVFIFSV